MFDITSAAGTQEQELKKEIKELRYDGRRINKGTGGTVQ